MKRAVVTALGKIGDERAVEPLEKTLEGNRDFFPVTSQLAVALGCLGSPSSIRVLDGISNHPEINTRKHVRIALQLLKGEIDRATFETQVGTD